MQIKNKFQGFTLIELLLVMVIISSFIYMGSGYLQQRTQQLRIDRTSAQMQQILNAAMSYYVNYGKWPCAAGSTCDLTTLKTAQFLPSGTFVSPWGAAPYQTSVPTNKALFTVSVTLPLMSNQVAIASVIAGKLPLANVTTCVAGAAGCTINAYVNIPGQNLNNATGMNFAGLYHHGGCVPVPKCPVDVQTGNAMTPQVFVVPVSVSGVNDSGSANAYPIESFTAYALGNPATDGTSPPLCNTKSTTQGNDCLSTTGTDQWGPAGPYTSGDTASAYWRVCLQVVTQAGNVAVTRTDSVSSQFWGQNATLGAFTRCAVSGEPAGSTFSVFGN